MIYSKLPWEAYNMALYGIILAAGEGKRMKSKTAKPLQLAGGKALIDYVVEAVDEAGADRKIVVIGHMAEEVREHLGESVEYAYQYERLGTGHAVMQAAELLGNADGTALIVCGDTPLISAESLKSAYDEHREADRAATVITAVCDNPHGYGRIVRKNGEVVRIVEQKDATEDEKQITEINSGMYLFDVRKLIEALARLGNNNAQGEYYLTEVVEILLSNGERIGAYQTDFEETVGVNDRVQLAEADALLNRREVKRLMLDGVRILNPETVRVDCGVRVGRDTVIYPNTILEGNCEIGEDCVIGPNTRICDCKIGNRTELQSSVALQSEIGSGTSVGPFAYIRPNSKIGDNIKVGDFVEVKNATIGNNTKIAHLTYVGDADVGERVNFGCGTVVVNYDGAHKHRTTIGDDCFIGCNTNLVSPVTVNNGAYTAAGSTITDEVPENALAIARARQVNKTGWKRPKK